MVLRLEKNTRGLLSAILQAHQAAWSQAQPTTSLLALVLFQVTASDVEYYSVGRHPCLASLLPSGHPHKPLALWLVPRLGPVLYFISSVISGLGAEP